MSTFTCRIARRSLCKACLLPRRAQVHCSQSALSSNTSASVSASSRRASQSNVDTRDPLDSARLDRYLSSIRAATLEPTLDDVERCKPESFSRPDSSRYATEYTNLLGMLCRSFSKDQLRRFTELYKLDPVWTRSSRRKTEYAESIIEKAWGWPSLKEIERKRRDATEVLIKSFSVSPSQLFLIMGKDGADLLQLSVQHNVHISLTSNPLSLRVEGLRGSLKSLTEHISSLKKGMTDEIFELSTGRPIRTDLLQRISRLSGAYVENHGNRGKVRICAKDTSDIVIAKQLALRASLEVGTQGRTVCYDPPGKIKDSPIETSEPSMYSLYPFVAPYPFPWTIPPGGAFRLRRLADWLGVNSYDDKVSTRGLADNPDRLLNFGRSEEELSQLIRPAMPDSISYSRRTITASPGHMLLSFSDKSRRSTLSPPQRSALSLSEVLKWIQNSAAPITFVPSVPSAMSMIAANKTRTLHRLIYKTLPHTAGDSSQLPQQVLKFEIDLPSPLSTAIQDIENEHFKDVLSSEESKSSSGPLFSGETDSRSSNLIEELGKGLDPKSCQVGREIYINLMFPDRPMDVQLCVLDSDDISLGQQPQVLRDYARNLSDLSSINSQFSQLDPPLMLSFKGREYYLYESLRLRRSRGPIASSTISDGYNADEFVEVCNETVVDIQSAQKMELCQLNFDGATDGPSWKHFLTACDQLSIASLESRSSKGKLQAFV